MKKKLISLLLVLCLVLAITPAAFAGWENPFTDVDEGQWYYPGVEYVCAMGLFNGVDADSFEPGSNMNRAMLVTVLWRYAGKPEAKGGNPFSDVPSGQWYTQPIIWASSLGIVNGVGEGKFDPNGNLSREQLAAILYRYTKLVGGDVSAAASLGAYPDSGDVSSYAHSALAWAVAKGIITGKAEGGKTLLAPKADASRAQVATMIMRYAGLYSQPEASPEPETPAADNVLRVGKLDLHLGMTESQLISAAGQPAEKLSCYDGSTWYVYGVGDYSDFFMAGVYGGKLVKLCSAGVSFSFQGYESGSKPDFKVVNGYNITVMLDRNDGNILHAIMLTDMRFEEKEIYTAETHSGESKAIFHMTNAFRVYHGLHVLQWCDKAAAAARLHSEDMAVNNYFSHHSQDGRNPDDRMEAQGITGWRACAENIAAGYPDGVGAYNGWVNSAGHRSAMLSELYKYLGVGSAYADRGASGSTYYTQNFYDLF